MIGKRGANPRQDEFDAERGIYTHRREPVWKLGIRSPSRLFALHYEAVETHVLEQAFSCLEGERGELTFLDLGCGNGRALVIAQEAGFGSIIGVELPAKLTLVAKKNLAKLRINTAQIIRGYATDIQLNLPNLALYMFNPFGLEVMTKVVSQILSADISPQYIIYVNPIL